MLQKKRSGLSGNCSVCSGPSATHLHYGAVSCYSCRAFFRRGIGKHYCCVAGTGDCVIDWTSRRSCQWCRFDKCLRVGMNPLLVDASLKKKLLKRKVFKPQEDPELLQNIEQLEDIGEIAELLQNISYEHNKHGLHPSSFFSEFDDQFHIELSSDIVTSTTSSCLSDKGNTSDNIPAKNKLTMDDMIPNVDIFLDDKISDNNYVIVKETPSSKFTIHPQTFIDDSSFINKSAGDRCSINCLSSSSEILTTSDYLSLVIDNTATTSNIVSTKQVVTDRVNTSHDSDDINLSGEFDKTINIESLVEECFRELSKS